MKIRILFIVAFLVTIKSSGQSLEEYLSIAEINSPELTASNYMYERAVERITEVGSLPNTTIGVGYFVQEAETRVGAQKAKLSIAQKLPWFGTLNAKEEGAYYKAQAQLNNIDFVKRNLFLSVKKTYYELYELKAKKRIISENIEILKTFEELALNELENNRSSMVDVLKIRMEKNELNNSLSTIDENFMAKQIAFNLLLNRDENLLINVVDEIQLENENELFQKELISENPQLLKLDNLKNALEKSELATKKEGLPMIGVGLDYVLVDNRLGVNLDDNGKDIIMPMVTVSIPLFSKKYSSKQKQLNLEQKAIESTKTEVENKLITIFENAESSIVNAKISVRTQIENIIEAERAKEVLLAGYQTSKIDFDQLLEVQQLKLKFQLKKVVSEKVYGVQKSTIEFLIDSI